MVKVNLKALERTEEEFTNKLDSKVNPRYTVHEIIAFYLKCASVPSNKLSNIERGFVEAQFEDMANEFEDELERKIYGNHT
jgi:hypothetical protein